MPRRKGTNFQDRNAIKDYVSIGVTNAGMIAANLNLDEGPVANYVESLINPPKPKPKPTRKSRKPAAAPPVVGATDPAPDNDNDNDDNDNDE